MLENKVAVITGGTRGIGYQTAKTFLKNGAKIFIFGTRKETVEKALEQLKKEIPNADAEGMHPDITNFDQVQKAIKEVKEKAGRIDILINNAGISSKESFYEYTSESFEKIINLNVKAVFNCAKAAAPIMKTQGGGVILNTSSMVSIYGQAAGVGYPTSKFAVNGLTKSLARELGKDNIRVNAVAPGIIETDMFKSLPEELRKTVTEGIPLKRLGEPQDIANAFLFLASDLATYVNGEILSVDGAAMV